MTPTIFRTATVSIAALSLSACMNFGSQGKPWSPEFGQAQAPAPHQSAYYNGQHMHSQAPMYAPEMAAPTMAYPDSAQSQHLSPLPKTYPQPSQTYSSQQPSYGAQPMQTQPQTYTQPRTYGQPAAQTSSQQANRYMSQYQSAYAPLAPTTPAQTYQTQQQQPMMRGQANQPYIQMQNSGQSNMLPWGQAMAWMYQGHVKSVMQTKTGDITMILHNGQTATTQSPRVDDVKRLKQDCGTVCADMVVATE